MPQEKEENRNTIIYAVIAKEPKLKDVEDVLVDLPQLTFATRGDRDKPLNIHYTNIRFRRWILTNFASG